MPSRAATLTAHRGASLWRRHWPLWPALLLAIPVAVYDATVRLGPDFLTVDLSWRAEMPWRLAHGQWAGRDFAFTYGPLYQLLHLQGFLLPGDSLAWGLRLADWPEAWLCTLVWYGLLVGVGAAPRGRAALLGLWGAVYFVPASLGAAAAKPVLALGLVAWLAHLVAQPQGRGVLRRPVALHAAPLAILYSFDLGIITSLVLALTMAGLAALAWNIDQPAARRVRRLALESLLTSWGSLLLLALVMRLLPGWQHYLGDAWQIASSYAVMQALPLAVGDMALLVVAGAGCLLAAAAAAWQLRQAWRAGQEGAPGLVVFFALALFCGAWLRYATTRSDAEHITRALLPALFLLACLTPAVCQAMPRLRRPSWVLPCLLLTLLPSQRDWLEGAALRLRGLTGQAWGAARREVTHPGLARARREIPADAGRPLYTFPYESIVNLLVDRPNPAHTLQAYSASNEYLEQRTINCLAELPDLEVWLTPGAGRLDGLPHETRNGHIWRYLLEQFEAAGYPDPSGLLLRRATAPRGWVVEDAWPRLDTSAVRWPAAEAAAAAGQPAPLELSLGSVDLRASDPFVLRLRVAPTPDRGLFKCGWIGAVLELSPSNTAVSPPPVPLKIVPDGQSHEVLLSACDLASPWALSQFLPSRQLRTTQRVAKLRLWWLAIDRLSRQPAWFQVEGLSIWRRPQVSAREVSLDDPQGLAQGWRWCLAAGSVQSKGKQP